MKKTISLILVLALSLSLCACGQESAPAQTELDNEEEQSGQTAETTAEAYYVEEEVLADGSICFIYRDGGPEGMVVKSLTEATDEEGNAYSLEVSYDAQEKPISMRTSFSDGSYEEAYFHPNGFSSKVIIYDPDGAYHEMHYSEDGTMIGEKYINADGEDVTPDTIIDEDGSRWITSTLADGTITEVHMSADFALISQTITHSNSNRIYKEFYDDGNTKIQIQEIGKTRIEEHFDEEGYHTYYYQTDPDGYLEIITDETGKVVKVIFDGAEKSDIDYWVKNYNFRSW